MRLIILFLLLLILIPLPAFSQPPVCYFFGEVTIGGEKVPDGTKVEAFIGGEKVKETTTKNSEYAIKITQPEGKSYAGKEVIFRVNGKLADKGGIWEAGEVKRVDLNVPLVTPPETPTAPPVCFFRGKVLVNGDTVADGTEIVAYINDEEVGKTTSSNSTYLLKITQPEGKSYEGMEVVFKVMGYEAQERGKWEMGETKDLDLHAKTPKNLTAIFYGDVRVDGGGVPDGTVISAYIGGELCGTAETLNSKYTLKVIQPQNRNYEGKKVTFKIGNFEAREESIWSVGMNIALDLSARIGAILSLEPSKREICAEESFTLYVVLEPKEKKITSAEFELSFSALALEALSVEAGKVMGEKLIRGAERIEPGKVVYGIARSDIPKVAEKGNLAIVKFRARKEARAGEYEIDIKKASLSDEEFKPVKNIILRGCRIKILKFARGDINRDGSVDYMDLAILRSVYGLRKGDANFNPYADLKEDGVIDYKDLAVLGANYGE